ncbi:MAG TPA: cell wall-binding repeat-containing protein [Ornithinibacter sp.]|nr:cell wall-binding repeat-containing protein [Ornithinibacter sp.]
MVNLRGRSRLRGGLVAVAMMLPLALATDISAASTPAEVTAGLPASSGIGAVPAGLAAIASPPVTRYGGADRFATAVAVSKAAFPDGTRPPVVFLASGRNFPDALSAAPAAAALGGITLLSEPGQLPPVVASELARLAPERVVVVGGTDVVSASVEAAAGAYTPVVERVEGTDRYQTSRLIAEYAFPNGAQRVWLATGVNFPDGLTAGAAAGANREPLVLIRGGDAGVDAPTAALLGALDVGRVVIAGGTGVVSAGLESSIPAVLPGTEVVRAAGADRYQTGVEVMRLAHPTLQPGRAFVATGTEYPDALVGGAYAGLLRRPLYLTTPLCAFEPTRQQLLGPSVTSVTLLGSYGAVRGLVGTLTPCLSLGAASSIWVVVNKTRPLNPLKYAPNDLVTPNVTYPNGARLRSAAASAVSSMFSAAVNAGAGRMKIVSGYRSYDTQYNLYWTRVRERGQAYTDRWIARPGYSEHQTGLTLDVGPVGDASCSEHTCIAGTPQGRWLAANAWRYGFIVRYESGQESVTGYNPEPWHLRYVGVPLSTDYRGDGFHALETYTFLPSSPTYPGSATTLSSASITGGARLAPTVDSEAGAIDGVPTHGYDDPLGTIP